ncbi:MAG: hypothetical protein COV57_02280 [Candidatus Liptonbacteria bacterium CG11_big_fil_rev_8_21_14_0_20_35_14]|uniref:PEGA domain-containing protein n=1 Tax=Candidatus Liptonbacteria bacterium CG11_big_fil_rev_8_21_14_0_20_35_14 TaxID=1974634 RepID=A0A2H0N9M5_9BACT|nr:MAG: hypothetical protein COV57_02280 [Candidatus Liptonbacteria bacterium CG11_big_fil_rev_8_21_14_0_20_35_14]
MSKGGRRVLFYSLVLVFIIVGTITIFYSRGFRIDFDTLTLKKTGAIFIRTEPKESILFVDDKEIKRNDGFLLSGTLVKNLVPQTYKIRVSKEGYIDWINVLPVNPGVVTEVKDILLLPEAGISFENTSTSTKDFWLFSDVVILADTQAGLIYNGYILSGDIFIKETIDHDKVITYNARRDTYLMNDVNNKSTININLLFNTERANKFGSLDKGGVINVLPSPRNSGEVVVLSQRAIYILNIDTKEVKLIYDELYEDALFRSGDLIVYSKNKINFVNIDTAEIKKVITVSQAIKDIKIFNNSKNDAIILLKNGSLNVLQREQYELKEIDKEVKSLYTTENNLFIYLKESGLTTIYNTEKERALTTQLPRVDLIKDIKQVLDNHFLVLYPDSLFLMHVADFNIGLENPQLSLNKMVTDEIEKIALDGRGVLYYLNSDEELYSSLYFREVF